MNKKLKKKPANLNMEHQHKMTDEQQEIKLTKALPVNKVHDINMSKIL
jgi:hypothetical protein